MLVRTSFNDSQVMYWEPAKYVAKMRALRTDHNILIFKTNLNPAGHGGSVRPLRPAEGCGVRLRVLSDPDGHLKLSEEQFSGRVTARLRHAPEVIMMDAPSNSQR